MGEGEGTHSVLNATFIVDARCVPNVSLRGACRPGVVRGRLCPTTRNPAALFPPRLFSSHVCPARKIFDADGSVRATRPNCRRVVDRSSSRAQQTEAPTAVAAGARASLLHLSPSSSPRARHHLPRDGWTTTTTAPFLFILPPGPRPGSTGASPFTLERHSLRLRERLCGRRLAPLPG